MEGRKSLQAADLGGQLITSTPPKPDGVGKVLVGWDPRKHCSPCSFLVSVLYSKAKLASACGGIIYFLSYVPYMYVAIREEVAHDKITAFEKCIAVSWLQQLWTCSVPGLPQAPHVQYKATMLSPSPGKTIACINATLYGALEVSPEGLVPLRARSISMGLGGAALGRNLPQPILLELASGSC